MLSFVCRSECDQNDGISCAAHETLRDWHCSEPNGQFNTEGSIHDISIDSTIKFSVAIAVRGSKCRRQPGDAVKEFYEIV